MTRILLFVIAIMLICGLCYADVIKGEIEKVDIKNYEITVNGERINIAKATIFTENEMNVVKSIIIRDIKDHRGEKAVCYGSVGKNNVFEAYKVKVLEDHR